MAVSPRAGVAPARGFPGTPAALVAALSLLMLLVAGSSPAEAGTWRIGRNQDDCPGGCHWYDDHPNVLEPGGEIAVAMASPSVIPGDTVMVWPGLFDERFPMKSNVALVSAEGADVTILCGQHGTLPMTTWSGAGPATVIDGFTVRWSSEAAGVGGGMALYVSSGVIRNCIFENCFSGIGSALYVQFSDVTIENCVFYNNTSTAGGGTLAITGGAPVVRGNTFIKSQCPPGFQGAALYASGYTGLVFERNIVTGSVGGSAIYCSGLNTSILECNLVWDNVAGSFGGTCVDSTGASGNITGDPLLCNPPTAGYSSCFVLPTAAATDYTVCANSPAVGAACGPIGYQAPLGYCAACGPVATPEGVDAMTWGQVKTRYR